MDNHPDEGHSRTENPKHSTAGVEQLSQVSPPWENYQDYIKENFQKLEYLSKQITTFFQWFATDVMGLSKTREPLC